MKAAKAADDAVPIVGLLRRHEPNGLSEYQAKQALPLSASLDRRGSMGERLVDPANDERFPATKRNIGIRRMCSFWFRVGGT